MGVLTQLTGRTQRFATLIEAVRTTGLARELALETPWTFFAPTDAAFRKLPQALLERLLSDCRAMKDLLRYHLVSGRVMAADLARLPNLVTLQGETLRISSRPWDVLIDHAKIRHVDLLGRDGVLHVIDRVLVPESIMTQW